MSATIDSTPSPRGALSKLRRNQGGSNNSANSLADSSNSDDPNADPERRPSTSSGIGKLKERIRRKSVQEDRRPSADAGNRLSKVLSGRKNKLRKTPSTDLEGRLRVDESSSTGNLALSGNRSDSSLGPDLNGSGRSSILTEDNSDGEG